MEQYDVLIAGAGASGLPAAVAAGRAGKRVLLLEREMFIGGAVTQHSINLFCGRPFQGIQAELLSLLEEMDPLMVGHNLFRTPVFLAAWTRMMKDLDITIRVSAPVQCVAVENGAIRSVRAGDVDYQACMYIDATGDGVLARMAGVPARYGREARSEYGEEFAPEKADRLTQMGTMMYTVQRMPGREDAPEANFARYSKDEYLIWGPTDYVADMSDPAQLGELQRRLYDKMPAEIERWREKGYHVTAIAPRVGIRETYRLVGDYTLSHVDIVEERKHPDCVCVCTYPVDPWDPEGNPFHDKEKKKKCATPDYGIPYRVLVNRAVTNLLFTGRCVSATHVANSSLRVMCIVAVLGQAAGVAAAMAVDSACAASAVDTQALRASLRAQGVRVDL